MGVLIIDREAKQRIAKLKTYAESNELSFDDLLDISNDPSKAAGYTKENNILLDEGYRVVFTIEEQPKFKAKHISISLNEKHPPLEAVELILREFGFGDIMDCYVYLEENAVNIIEPV